MNEYTFKLGTDDGSGFGGYHKVETSTLLKAEDAAHAYCDKLNKERDRGWHLVSVTKHYV